MPVERTTCSQSETEHLAEQLGSLLQAGDVVTLEGPLGAGKTTFVRGLAKGLHIDPAQVSSPTFVISQEYTAVNGPPLIHIDAYRFHAVDELESIGWEDMIASQAAIVAIEWPSRIEPALGDLRRIAVMIEPTSPTTRLITIKAPEEIAHRLKTHHD